MKNIAKYLIKYFTKFFVLTSVFHQSAAAQSLQNVTYTIGRGSGVVSGVISGNGNFRVDKISDSAVRKFSLSGTLLNGNSINDFKDDCKNIYRKIPANLRDLPDTLRMSGVLFPYTPAFISNLVGVKSETSLDVVGVDLSMALGPNAISRQVYATSNLDAFTKWVNTRMAINLEQVKKGENVDLNMTALGPLVCDLLTGDAKIRFTVRVRYQSAVATVFMPLSSGEIQTLSKSLIAGYDWNRSKEENSIVAGAIVMEELQKLRKIDVHLSSNDSQRADWTVKTFTSVVTELFDPASFKPKFLDEATSDAIAKRLTLSFYGTEAANLIVDPTFDDNLE